MRRIVLFLLAATALTGCHDEAPPEEARVREVLKTFSTSVEKRDYQVLCDEVFAPKLLQGLQQIGLPCEVAMRNSLGSVKSPKLTVGKVTIKKNEADAEIKTSARGQAPSNDTIRLTRISGTWKVSALGTPDPRAPRPARARAAPEPARRGSAWPRAGLRARAAPPRRARR